MVKKTKQTLTVLLLGDVNGKIGRRCVAKVLPELREEYRPDLVVANAENLAHGKGMNEASLRELLDAGVDLVTGGNHTFSKEEGVQLLSRSDIPAIRPANFPEGTAGVGARVIEVGSRKVLIVNLLGRVFMKQQVDDPFRTFDRILEQHAADELAATVVDFHAEVTSEKVAFGWYADGRASIVVGTHTHVPTADAWVLPKGTAYVTDLGMCGGRDTVIGGLKEPIVQSYLSSLPAKYDPPDEGRARFNSVLVQVDPTTHHAVNIERLDREVDVP